MTVKIIKQGTLPKVVQYKSIYKRTCNSCKTEFEYESEDIKRVEIAWYGPVDCDQEEVIYCPFCGHYLKHKESSRREIKVE